MSKPSAQVIAHSISPKGVEIATLQLRYWRPIHGQLLTHRDFSRNSGSSRARPVAPIIEQVRNNPWGPTFWGREQPGMQPGENIAFSGDAKESWKAAAEAAADFAEELAALKLHKQIVNRVLEPYTYIDTLVTSTRFNNWFALRNHDDAQTEIDLLAQVMYQALADSTPQPLRPGEWHLPYIEESDWGLAATHAERHPAPPGGCPRVYYLRQVSAARCARISYRLFDGSLPSLGKDLALYQKLVGATPVHASPTEHQATPDTWLYHDGRRDVFAQQHLAGNLHGWVQHRKLIPNEYVP